MVALRSLAAACCALAVPYASAASAPPDCRDRWLEPFASDSIWNTAIGSAARFEPASLFDPEDPRGLPDNCELLLPLP